MAVLIWLGGRCHGAGDRPLLPSLSAGPEAALARARINFFIDTWNTKVSPLWFQAMRAGGEAQEAKITAWIDALKKDRTTKEDQIKRIEQDAKRKAEQAEATHAEALSKALAAERQKQKELEETLGTVRTEKDALADQARLETIDWREKLDRAAERSRTVEAELKH